jgi:hypothetical protein
MYVVSAATFVEETVFSPLYVILHCILTLIWDLGDI